MDICKPFCAVVLVLLVAGCSSAEKRKHQAEAEYAKEKTKTLQEYKACVKKAKGDEKKLQNCEALLKALEASQRGSQPPEATSQ